MIYPSHYWLWPLQHQSRLKRGWCVLRKEKIDTRRSFGKQAARRFHHERKKQLNDCLHSFYSLGESCLMFNSPVGHFFAYRLISVLASLSLGGSSHAQMEEQSRTHGQLYIFLELIYLMNVCCLGLCACQLCTLSMQYQRYSFHSHIPDTGPSLSFSGCGCLSLMISDIWIHYFKKNTYISGLHSLADYCLVCRTL